MLMCAQQSTERYTVCLCVTVGKRDRERGETPWGQGNQNTALIDLPES